MYEVKKYEMVLEAVTPVAHMHGSFGNHSVLARRKVRLPDGSFAHVPAISGDSLRHGLREAGALAFLGAAGMLDGGQLTEAALRLLFTGGMVTGVGDASAVRLDDYRRMVDLLPPLALLGGCAGNRVIPGRTVVEDAVLLCEESQHVVPAWTREVTGALTSARAHVEIHQRVRMDASRDPARQRLLTGDASIAVDARGRKREAAAESDDAVAKEDAKSSMMPRTFEAIAAGAHFSWRVEAVLMSDLEEDVWHGMLVDMLGECHAGSRRATGFGALRVVASKPIDMVTLRGGERFRAHVRERADDARAFLSTVNA